MTKKFFVLVLLGIVFAIILITLTQGESTVAPNRLEELNVKLESLRVEKNRIEDEINDKQEEYDALVNGKGNLVLMFKDVDNRLYTEIKNGLSKHGMVGTILLSKKEFPGQNGCMTMDQFKEMIQMGWKYYINWEAGESKDAWISYWSQKLSDNGLEMPKVVHFEKNAYSEELDAFLLQNGFEVCIQQDIGGSVLIVNKCEEAPWDICTAPWNASGAKTLMQQAASTGGTIVFAIGSQKDTEEYKAAVFESMIATLGDYVKNDKILITDVLSAKSDEEVPVDVRNELELINKEIDDLKKRLEEVETEMDKSYEEFKKINE